MKQTVDGREVYVVEFDALPTMPITWNNEEEKPYAQILQDALQDGIITEPGKYGLEILPSRDPNSVDYTVHLIKE